MTAPRPTVICVTPVKNEAWIMERFLACASTWADHIVIADQGSTDGTRAIAAACPKVHLVDFPSEAFDEPQRRRALLEAARRIPGPRLIVSLDADEILSANWETSPEWATVLRAAPGTVVAFRLVNIAGDLESGWTIDWNFFFAYMDDGAMNEGEDIHPPRLPMPPDAPRLLLRDIRVLHYAMADLGRYDSRQRWYQCYEILRNKPRRNVALYRMYHHHEAPTVPRLPLRPEWTDGYKRRGIDVTSIVRESAFRWDRLVLGFFEEHGTRRFRRINIWRPDWTRIARDEGLDGVDTRDPRSRIDRMVFRYLDATQPRRHTRMIRWMDRLLHGLGW
jgi:glycosyltransferase involved in cell wall biosynthesis